MFCRNKKIPIFYTEAVREASGIDFLTRFHRVLPLAREERLKSSHHGKRNMGCSNNRRN